MFTAHFKELLASSKLTCFEIAIEAGIRPSTLSQIVHGTTPRPQTYVAIEKILSRTSLPKEIARLRKVYMIAVREMAERKAQAIARTHLENAQKILGGQEIKENTKRILRLVGESKARELPRVDGTAT